MATGLTPPMFDGKGFLSWKRIMRIHLRSEQCLSIVEGTEAKPQVKNPGDQTEEAALNAWKLRDEWAVVLICTCLASPIFMKARRDFGSEVLWKWLETRYNTKQEADSMRLYNEVKNMRFQGGELRQHIDRMKEVFDALAGDPDYAFPAGLQKIHLYKSLPYEWQDFVDSLTANSTLTWSDVTAMLLQKESRMKVCENQTVSLKQAAYANVHGRGKVLKACDSQRGNQNVNSNKQSSTGSRRDQCRICTQRGHFAKDCPQR